MPSITVVSPMTNAAKPDDRQMSLGVMVRMAIAKQD
jgi:hypothetical protein